MSKSKDPKDEDSKIQKFFNKENVLDQTNHPKKKVIKYEELQTNINKMCE